jgi:3-dehydroquinate dehydratase/shikimate dehydrogenase
MTMIAASIAVNRADEVDSAVQWAARSVLKGARLIEWRLDALAESEEGAAAAAALVRRSPAPCIITCRGSAEGGRTDAPDAARIELIASLLESDAAARPRYVDLELATFARDTDLRGRLVHALERSNRGRDLTTSLILSAHDFNGRPADLLQRIEAMSNDPSCAIVKVAWHARSIRDNLEAFELLSNRAKPMIALCMGPFGLMSRVLAPKFGGFLTFASDSTAQATAPGQPTIDELVRLYRFDRITPSTRVYGVLGWPVEHSLSPAVHNAGFEAIGLDGVYLPMPIPAEYEHFKATVGAMIDAPGLDFRGASVTIPHKEHLLRFVRERGGRSDAMTDHIGAANTLLVGSAGGLECLNTDCPAAIAALCRGMKITEAQLEHQRIAVLGAGGAARAVIFGLLHAGAEVTVFNRNPEPARRLVDDLQVQARERGRGSARCGSEHELRTARFDVIINCTPVGMSRSAAAPASNSGGSPLPEGVKLDESVTVFDTVYTPARTPLIQEAEARGARAISGLEMFIRQAAMQFERWTGVPAPIATFERALSLRAQTAAGPHPS